MFTDILNVVENYSGVICAVLILILTIIVKVIGNRIVKELKFLYRRSEILDVNDTMRHIPRDLKNDYFSKQEGEVKWKKDLDL